MMHHQLLLLLGYTALARSQSSASQPFSSTATISGSSDSASSALPVTSAPSSISPSSISSIISTLSSSISSTAVPSQNASASGSIPIPQESPIPGLFRSTDPLDPPGVEDSSVLVPDFSPAWQAAYEKARAKVAGFSLEDLVTAATGVNDRGFSGRCVGNIAPIDSSGGWDGLCLEDGPLGVRPPDFVTVFPTGLNTAATFNRSLIRQRGLFMGLEHKGKGVNVALGPMMNLLRVAEAGRNFEGFGADPFLTGEAAYETILGMQQGGVQACAKHFIDNEQETSRMSSSSNVDDRTQHEIYAHPFLRSVMAGTASVMCSYNQINSTFACENNKTISGILKEEFGFPGFMVSDWGATHSTVASTVAGLDMDMPGSGGFFGNTLVNAVRNGQVPMSRITDMATRILAAWYFLHQDDPSYPAVNFNANAPLDEATNEHVDVQDNHRTVVREIGAASTILLKNVGGALPLKKPRSLFLAGSDSGPGSSGPNGVLGDGVLGIGGGSGSAMYTYLINPVEAIQERARDEHTSISWLLNDFDLSRARSMALGKSAALVFVNAASSEGSDRTNLTLWHGGEALIQAVAANNKNTMVVIHTVGPLLVEQWIDHPNITAVIWAGAPGQEAGNSLVDVLYGDFNPSGRLPFTIAKRLEDYPAQVVRGSGIVPVPYTDGLEIDYRAFDARNITPRFEFGFGMSYTKFEYNNLQISPVTGGPSGPASDQELIKNWEAGNVNPSGFGTSTALWLHRPAFEVSFDVKNVGDIAGGEIPQLYLAHPASAGEPPQILKGFADVLLNPGETKRATIHLSRHSLSIWDTAQQGWKKPDGDFGIIIGASSRDHRLTGSISV